MRSHLVMHVQWKWWLQGRAANSAPSSYDERQTQHSWRNKGSISKAQDKHWKRRKTLISINLLLSTEELTQKNYSKYCSGMPIWTKGKQLHTAHWCFAKSQNKHAPFFGKILECPSIGIKRSKHSAKENIERERNKSSYSILVKENTLTCWHSTIIQDRDHHSFIYSLLSILTWIRISISGKNANICIWCTLLHI